MIKVHLLFMIAIVSGFLLTLQLISLQILVRKNTEEQSPAWILLKTVTNAAYQNGVPLFLTDSIILSYVSNGTLPSKHYSYCKLLCSGRKLTHLATLYQHASHLHLTRFAQTLRDLGYTILEFNELDPTLIHHDFKVLIPLHLIIFNENIDLKLRSHVVHITIFHDRISQNYFWQGPLLLNENDLRLLHRQGIKRTDFKMSDQSAIYDKPEILHTKIDGVILNLPKQIDNFMKKPEDVRFIECDKVKANKFTQKYGRDESEEANSFRIKALSLLTKAKKVLDELEIPFWLSSGTCLGYFRQCDFITYGKDIDIGIWIQDYRPQLIHAFSVNDLPLIHSFGKVNDSFELSFREGDIKLDVFFFYKEDDHVWNGGTQARTGLKFQYIFPKFSLCWTEFFYLKVRIPCETQAYIEANYGSNWFEPIKEWDWKSSPPNVRQNGQWPVEEWNQVIKLNPYPEE